MIIDDLANLFEKKRKEGVRDNKMAEIFNKERKWVIMARYGYSYKIDYNFVAGLRCLGYELKLVEVNKNENNT